MMKKLLAAVLVAALLTGAVAAAESSAVPSDATITLQMLKTAVAQSAGARTLTLSPAFPAGTTSVSIRLPLLELAVTLADTGTQFETMCVQTPVGTVAFSARAVRAAAMELGETALLTVKRLSAAEKSGSVHASLQGQPVYAFSLTDGQGRTATLPAGTVSVSIPYGLLEGEQGQHVSAVRVGEAGAMRYLPNSAWSDGNLVFLMDQFSTYAVAVRVVTFPDIAAHWAKTDIEFAAARGILVGVSDDAFQPDGNVLWAQAVTALSRMAGANPVAGSGQAWYAPYVTWAVSNGMMSSAQDPTATITREEMAGLLAGFLRASGYNESTAWTAALEYADRDNIAPGYWRDVAFVGAKGLLKGRPDGTFAPHGLLTRAELATILGRIVRLQISL